MMRSPALHILVVDDDPKVRLLLRRCFEGEGYRVSEAAGGAEAGRVVAGDPPHLVTLDISLPDIDGLAVARDIRSRSDVPIIMVTGKGETIDRVVGLELGADDYITKPFHLREVLARVRAVLRRTGARHEEPAGRPDDRYEFDGWRVDLQKRSLTTPSGRDCPLTTAELNLLEVFVLHPNRVLSRDQIMDLMKGQSWNPLDRSIDNLVAKLRRKIEPNPEAPELVKTVRGLGYLFTARVQRAG
ncbi:MAG: response regulator transcription factor [Pseudomonadota bacterium]